MDNAQQRRHLAIHDLQEKLKYAYAVHIKLLIPGLIKARCLGCEIEHPSQTKHICCMFPIDTQLELCFDEALNTVDEKAVLALWKEIRPIVPEEWLQQTKLTDPNYRDHIWKKTPQFIDGVQAIISDILMD